MDIVFTNVVYVVVAEIANICKKRGIVKTVCLCMPLQVGAAITEGKGKVAAVASGAITKGKGMVLGPTYNARVTT